jgi:hypothetical protein
MLLAKNSASSQQKKGNHADWRSLFAHGFRLQGGKRLSFSSAIRPAAHLNFGTPRRIRLSRNAHSSENPETS